MSLVNDALKRAKQAQEENPPKAPPLEFRPVEPAQEGGNRSPLLLLGGVLGLTVAVLLGGLLIWVIANSQSARLQAEAKTLPAAEGATTNTAPASSSPQDQAGLANTPEEAMTNTQPVAVEAPPPEFKLQGIFYNPRSPSAVVNGRTVYVGDRVTGYRVITITPEAVTLSSGTQTNVLSLSP